jgi:NADH-quinone oxidoreductase subunit H
MKIFLFIIISVLNYLLIILPMLISVAFLTLIERKVLAATQRRVGPNFVGFLGLLQPIADAVKLIVKETILPRSANILLFIIAPLVTFFLSLSAWAVIPLNAFSVASDINLGILYIFTISSLSVYGIVIAGWASNSHYAFLGALRSAAQMISYEVSLGLILINVILCAKSLNLTKIVNFQEHVWFIFPLFPLFLMFFVSALAETNRPPFDLPEAEGELVAGYNVEYSSIGFTLFFIAEYANIILISVLTVIIFLGGWLPPSEYMINLFSIIAVPPFLIPCLNYLIQNDFFQFSTAFLFIIKLDIVLFTFIWVRATFPRYRYDQLMRLGWKVFLPMSLGMVILTSSIIFFFN